jgi:hypothetical protein
MHAAHQLCLGEIQLVVTAIDEHTARVQRGAHSAVAEDGAAAEDRIKTAAHAGDNPASWYQAIALLRGAADTLAGDQMLCIALIYLAFPTRLP